MKRYVEYLIGVAPDIVSDLMRVFVGKNEQAGDK